MPSFLRRPVSRNSAAAALILLGSFALTGCKSSGTEAAGPTAASATPTGAGAATATTPAAATTATATATTATATPAAASTAATSTAAPAASATKIKTPIAGTPAASGPRVVSFKIVQKPKCAEGTAVFRAKAVPLIIKWKITGADSAALSVDDPTHTAGTYGPEPLSGTETFEFSCAGAVGTVETHTYAIYTVGGGTQKSKSLKASAKILDKGPNSPS